MFRSIRKQKLLSGICLAALSLDCSLATSVSAATYMVSNETELSNAITAANASGDASATIVLTSGFSTSIGTIFPIPSKPIAIDTQGFTITGAITNAPLSFDHTGGNTVTIVGTFVGGDGAGATAGGFGLYTRSTINRSSIVNNGSITGGAGGAGGGAGGVGARLLTTNGVNNGTIRGGEGRGGGAGGAGVEMTRNSVLINNGLIEGGQGATGGAGVHYTGPINASMLVNNGTIRGGTGTAGSLTSSGVLVRFPANQIVNTGTIEGGTGGAGIAAGNGTINLDIVNSGTIRAGAGQADAINRSVAATTGTLTLELQAGYAIVGNVVAGVAPTTDTLRLGGAGNDSFDVSAIGVAAQYRNFDVFEKTGSSKWTLTGTDTATTNWTIYDGTLAVNGTVGGTMDVRAGGVLQGIGQVGTTTSAGTIAPGNSIGTLTIAGNYTGTGGTLEVEAVLGGDASPTDLLVVTGNTAGTTNVKVINLGGGGAQTAEGIKIVDVGGVSGGSFSLLGDYVFEGDQAVVGGAYAYRLYQGGTSTPADGDWYLRSALLNPAGAAIGMVYAPGVPLYETYAGVLQSLNEFGTLRQRSSGRAVDEGQAENDPAKAIWTRIDGTHAHFNPRTSTTGTEYDVDTWTLQAGIDGMLHESGAGALIGGVSFHFDTASADISSRFGKGSIDTTGYGFDGTLTWYGNSGFYVDTQAAVTWYDSNINSSTLQSTLADGNDGFGYGLSVEAGQKIALTRQWSLTPQAQLAYSSVRFDDFTDAYGAAVSLDDADSLTGRLGISADYDSDWKDATGQISRSKFYGIANLYYDFLDGSKVDVSGLTVVSKNQPLWGGLSLGGSLSWSDDRYAVHAEAFARTNLKDFGDSNAVGAKVGFSVKW
ncbi:autotransporter outer membrane beta-barrel domain-containing protein [Neorhizobium galegae]|uniref:autotransporter family protein n=1 Tax=Neorhizobium galegae TaxID=399 RepID=UPI0021013D1E|nr:autotransporter outer membrane beta-barrel domain-containing protein [Neorhizobium galegae]MCQ1574255.1 autotransporter outer membrane beta-barrel domain-containing protein [Neorhizobium galegae]MCQ1837635.1 autotransporter outer membrane beta-barrel domain-containing protein [Neorhizobium galegae]UIY31670.1 autotransporter outer membrane beta-barrel domain-containing protein [Neorhizobium galegae]